MPSETCDRILIERYFLGEDAGGKKREAIRHMEGCADCRGFLATLQTDKEVYLLEHPFRNMPLALLPARKYRWKTLLWSPRRLPVFAALAACLVLLPLVGRLDQVATSGPASPAGPDTLRLKGGPGDDPVGGPMLECYFKRQGQVQTGHPSMIFRAGDVLQFIYAADGFAFVSLASVDMRGKVSLYRPEPENPVVSQAVEPGGRRSLPFGVTLDATPGSELFVMIFSREPVRAGDCEAWLRDAAARAGGDLERAERSLPRAPGEGSAAKTLLLRKGNP
jgi:hypothetical protein